MCLFIITLMHLREDWKGSAYHEMTNGGHTYIEMMAIRWITWKPLEKVVRQVKGSGVGYGSVNHPVDRDPVCGYSGVGFMVTAAQNAAVMN